MKLPVRIDRDVCIGAENCLRYAPKTFETDDQSKAVLKSGPWDPDETIRVAVTSCPVGALSIADAEDSGT